MKWTNADERELQSLLKKKEEFTRKNYTAVKGIVDEFYYRSIGVEDIVDNLIERAEQIRDALEAYDSGVRAEPPGDISAPPEIR